MKGFDRRGLTMEEFKQMEGKLRESEEKYRSMVELAPDGIITVDIKGVITSVNSTFLRLTGYSRNEIVGKHFTKLGTIRARDIPKYLKLMNSVLRGKLPSPFEFSYVRKNGTTGWGDAHVGLLKKSGKISGFQVILREISEQKKAEAALGESETKFRNIFESANDCMIYLDESGRILDVNRKAVEVFGGSKKELVGKHFTKVGVFSPRDMPRLISAFANILAGKEATINIYIRNKKGREIPLECSASFIKTDGKITGMMIIARDVTQRKIMEKRIAYLANIADNAKVAIATVDMNGIVTYCNKATEEMLGWTSKEVIGEPMARMCPNAGKQIEATLKEGFWLDKELDYLKKDGNSILCSTSTFLMTDKDGKPMGIGGIAIDITERKKMEEELVRLSSAVKMSNDSIVISDIGGKIIDVNEATLKMYGTDNKEDLIGKNSFDLIVPEERERAFAGMEDILEKGYLENREYHIITKDGGRIPVEMNVAIMKEADGEPMGFVGISRDITERKQMEERLRESEEQFRNLYESIKDPVVVWVGREGRLIEYNKAFKEQAGYTDEELKDKTFLDLLHPDDHAMVLERYRTKYPEEDFPLVFEIRVLNKKGEIIPLEISVSLYKVKGKVIGVEAIGRDITERKKAERALKDSEQKLRDVIDTSPDAIVWTDTTGKITLVNKKGFELTGYSKKELVGKNFMDIKALTQESKEKTLESFMKRLEGIDTPPYEVEVIAKNGEIIPAELSASPIFEEGKIVGTQSIFRDLRERKRTEEMLRESEERFRNLYESIQDPVGIYVGREGRLIEYNTAFKKMSGYTDEELKDKTFLDLLHPDDHAMVLEKYRTKYSEAELPLVYEIRTVVKNGKIIPVEISVSTYKVKGKVIGIEVIHRDITERKKMEEKLRQYSDHLEELVRKRTEELLESEKRYSVLVEEASDGVVILQDGKIVFANKKATEILGYSKDEITGLPIEKLVVEKHRQLVTERYQRRLRGEKVPITYEVELLSKTGECVPVELSATRINYQGRPADLKILRDIRERKRMEEQRLKLEKLAAIGELATMVGHDLRNPLQAIENATYYLNNELPRLLPSILISQKAVEMLQAINKSVNYADKIIKDLHDFSATKKPTLKKTNINTIVKEALLQVEAPKNIELTTELAHLPKIKADKDLIKRIFLNLTLNGIQAIEKGGTLKITTKKTKRFVEVSFKDTGIGIPKEDIKKIFSPFFTTKAQGMGMGLPICKKLVDIHGGNIEVESEEGKGSTFTVKLPIQQKNRGEKT